MQSLAFARSAKLSQTNSPHYPLISTQLISLDYHFTIKQLCRIAANSYLQKDSHPQYHPYHTKNRSFFKGTMSIFLFFFYANNKKN